jgi:uncharacterized RDD family membrane protein YckC
MWDGVRWIPAPPPPPPAPPPGYAPPQPYGQPAPGYGYAYPAPPAGPAPGIAYAGFLARTGAFILDSLMFVVPFIAFITVIAAYANQGASSNSAGVAIGVIGLVATCLAYLAYTIVLPAQGGTLGMRALRLRVARLDNGANIGMALSLGRWLVYLGIGVVGFGWLDVLWVIWDDRKQSLHDKAVATVVVRPIVP